MSENVGQCVVTRLAGGTAIVTQADERIRISIDVLKQHAEMLSADGTVTVGDLNPAVYRLGQFNPDGTITATLATPWVEKHYLADLTA